MNMIEPICKHTQFGYLEVWAPKYSTKRVLLACRKIRQHNKVVFTKAPSTGTQPYYISGATAKKYPKITNSTIWCYNVPLAELKPLELQECDHDYR